MNSELKHAFRTLAKSPGYAAVTVLTLALGIGATTAIFSIVNSVLLRPLDHPRSDQLVDVRVNSAQIMQYPTMPLNGRLFGLWAKCPAFEQLAIIDPYPSDSTLTGVENPQRLHSLHVSANLFETLRTRPFLGRLFQPGDDVHPGNPVVVISEPYWRNHFNADPSVIGKTIILDQEHCTIVGVLPAGFHLPISPRLAPRSAGTDVYLPKFIEEEEKKRLFGNLNYEGIGRLAPGATVADATAQADAAVAQVAAQEGNAFQIRSRITPLQDALVGDARPSLLLLLGAIAAVLLIACLNLAMLGLVRAERAAHEYAVRAALGASKGRLIAQSFAEAIIVSCAGGLLGIAVGDMLLRALLVHAPDKLPRLSEVSLDGRVLGFAFLLSAGSAIFSGMFPAWRCARSDLDAALRNNNRTTTGNRAEARLRQTLVCLQVAIGTVLTATAALLAGSFVHALGTQPALNPQSVLCTVISISPAKYPGIDERSAFYERMLTRIHAIPGAESAALSTVLPMQGQAWIEALSTKDSAAGEERKLTANVRFISPNYFSTLGLPLLGGRAFSALDGKHPVAIVSEKVAAAFWPGKNGLGQRFAHFGQENVEVIGIVNDLRTTADAPSVPVIYRTINLWAPDRAQLAVRFRGEPQAFAPMLRDALRDIDPDIALPALQTMSTLKDNSLAERRFHTVLAVVFGLAALALAGLGIYGVVSYSVARRTREIGIRAAFGAQAGQLRRMVLRQGLAPVLLGVGIGLFSALSVGNFFAAFLFETKPNDPAYLMSAAVILITVGIAACWFPARRATKVDPLDAIRAE